MKKLFCVGAASVIVAVLAVTAMPRVALAELGDVGFDNIFDQSVSVDLKVNGSDGPVTVVQGSRIVVSWISEGATRCRGNWSRNDIRLNGTIAGRITKSIVVKVACINRDGERDDDAVAVNVSGGAVIPNPTPTPTPTPVPVGEGQLQVSLDADSPAYRLITAGSTDVVMSVLRLHAVNEDIVMERIALQLLDNSEVPQNLSGGKVTLWKDGSQKVGEGVFIGAKKLQVFSMGQALIIPANTSVSLVVKVDIQLQGVSQAGIPGAHIAIDFDGDSDQNRAIGRSSGKNVAVRGGDTASAGIRIYKSIPTVKYIPLPVGSSLAGASDKPLYRFSVTASPNGSGVGIHKFTFRFTTSATRKMNGMLNNINVRAYTNSDFTGTVSGIQTDGTFMATDKPLTDIESGVSTDVEIYTETVAGIPTTLQIPAGATRYFEVIGDINLSGAGTVYSVITQLQGDAQPNTGMTPTGNFIWSPNSITTVTSKDANDYANGYGVPGLPASNLTPQILSDRAI